MSHWTPCTGSQIGFPSQFNPSQSLMSGFIKPFIPPRRTLNKGTSAFITSHSTGTQVLLFLLSPRHCVHPPGWCHPSSSPKAWQFLAQLQMCPSTSLHLAGITCPHTLCYPKRWQFTASCLGPLPRVQAASRSAVCKLSYLD